MNDVAITNDITSRFSGAVWFKEMKKHSILIGGCGGIGSHLAFLMSRFNPDGIIIVDPDEVEAGNMSGQLFNKDDVRQKRPKVNAISNTIRMFSDYYKISAFKDRITYHDPIYGNEIMMGGFDNMQARKNFFLAWREFRLKRTYRAEQMFFMDGRLTADCFQIFSFTGTDEYAINKYKNEYLFSDEEVEPTLCSYKQTTYMASMIASMMCNIYVQFITNLAGITRIIPFFTEYNANTMELKFYD